MLVSNCCKISFWCCSPLTAFLSCHYFARWYGEYHDLRTKLYSPALYFHYKGTFQNDLWASTFVGTTRENLLPCPLAVQYLDNWHYGKNHFNIWKWFYHWPKVILIRSESIGNSKLWKLKSKMDVLFFYRFTLHFFPNKLISQICYLKNKRIWAFSMFQMGSTVALP